MIKSSDVRLEAFRTRMLEAGQPDIAIQTFVHYFETLASGHKGLIPESDIQPVEALPNLLDLDSDLIETGRKQLGKSVMIKLNGGLGTSMGLNKAKSLLVIKQGLSFLDIIARQAIASGVPVLFMNSFVTETDTLDALQDYAELGSELPLSFLQHQQPKVDQETLVPAIWPDNPDLEWCPPGHGDIYTALASSGVLKQLLDKGYKYAFISNSDNLGATLDLQLLGYVANFGIDFLMEVANRSPSDLKGGHLAKDSDGNFLLREIAQCPVEDLNAFQDAGKHKFFNTNNIWINLESLESMLKDREYILGLPMIRNKKNIDPTNPESTPVYQLETAMGSAINLFDNAAAVLVPRSRFTPVKKTNDLLAVRSDAFQMSDDYLISLHPTRGEDAPQVDLDEVNYKFISDFDTRFPCGSPSLLRCRSLKISGDIKFGDGVTIRGNVHLSNDADNQLIIPDNAIIEG